MFNVIVLRMLRAVPLLKCLSCKIDFDFQIHQFSQVVVVVVLVSRKSHWLCLITCIH